MLEDILNGNHDKYSVSAYTDEIVEKLKTYSENKYALHQLGLYYRTKIGYGCCDEQFCCCGTDVCKSNDKTDYSTLAREYLEKAARLGNDQSMLLLARRFTVSKTKRLEYLTQAEKHGNLVAGRKLAKRHLQAGDLQTALDYYIKIYDIDRELFYQDLNLDYNEKRQKLVLDTVVAYHKQISELKAKLEQYQQDLVQKDQEIVELKYRPGAPGYEEAAKHFKSLALNS